MSNAAQFIHNTFHVLEVDETMSALFRCEAMALVNLDIMQLIASEDFRGLARLRMKVLRELNHVPEVRYPFRRCDGTMFWGMVRSEPMGDGRYLTTITYEYEA